MEKEKIKQSIAILNELNADLWLVVDKESELLSDPVMDYIVGQGVTWLSFFMFFRSGEKIALVGASGGGKSTLIQTLTGLYPAKSGMIYYDDVPINQITVALEESPTLVVQLLRYINSGYFYF